MENKNFVSSEENRLLYMFRLFSKFPLQFYVNRKDNNKILSCYVNLRSFLCGRINTTEVTDGKILHQSVLR